MRHRILLLALLALGLGLPAPTLASPRYGPPPTINPYDGYPASSYRGHGYPWSSPPLSTLPYGTPPPRRCSPAPALIGAALGGGLGALLADGSRNRRWALPMGAAFGGIVGGVMSGC